MKRRPKTSNRNGGEGWNARPKTWGAQSIEKKTRATKHGGGSAKRGRPVPKGCPGSYREKERKQGTEAERIKKTITCHVKKKNP